MFGGGGSKNFLYPPPPNCKTESGKFHEILTSVCGGSKNFFIPPKIVSVCVEGGGLKTETGKFLLHFQNSKSSNRCRSVYGTDIIKVTVTSYLVYICKRNEVYVQGGHVWFKIKFPVFNLCS